MILEGLLVLCQLLAPLQSGCARGGGETDTSTSTGLILPGGFGSCDLGQAAADLCLRDVLQGSGLGVSTESSGPLALSGWSRPVTSRRRSADPGTVCPGLREAPLA